MFTDTEKNIIAQLGMAPFTRAYCEMMLLTPLPSPDKTAVETFVATVKQIAAMNEERTEAAAKPEQEKLQVRVTYGESWLDTTADKAQATMEKRRTEIRQFVEGLRKNPLWSHI